MPFQPPTRPHSANPHAVLNSSLFPSSASSVARPPTNRTASLQATSSYSRLSRDWEDAWDSSSDNDEPTERLSNRPSGRNSPKNGMPIPQARRADPKSEINGGSDPVAASWASGSYQHISYPSSLSHNPLQRPVLITSKTYAEPTTAPPPGTSLSPSHVSDIKESASKLPPGGSWEIVDQAELKEPEKAEPATAGKEALRGDMEDILNGSSFGEMLRT